MNMKVPIAVLFACLLCPLTVVAHDADNDGIIDTRDNCVVVANTDQRDTDGDGFGNVCDADFNNDCSVNFADMLLFRLAFFGRDPHCDMDGDTWVNFADLQMIKLPFFAEPGPSGITNICN